MSDSILWFILITIVILLVLFNAIVKSYKEYQYNYFYIADNQHNFIGCTWLNAIHSYFKVFITYIIYNSFLLYIFFSWEMISHIKIASFL